MPGGYEGHTFRKSMEFVDTVTEAVNAVMKEYMIQQLGKSAGQGEDLNDPVIRVSVERTAVVSLLPSVAIMLAVSWGVQMPAIRGMFEATLNVHEKQLQEKKGGLS